MNGDLKHPQSAGEAAVRIIGARVGGLAGASIGGKAGAALGTAILPGAGTLLGAAVGSIGGALFGWTSGWNNPVATVISTAAGAAGSGPCKD